MFTGDILHNSQNLETAQKYINIRTETTLWGHLCHEIDAAM
jgi:hypothetical protein